MIRRAGRRLIPGRTLLRQFAKDALGDLFGIGEQAESHTASRTRETPAQKTNGLKKNEAYYRDTLARTLNGRTEVVTPDGGRIDVMTSREIVEVKHVKHWRSALGQIQSYGYYYPRHQQRIYLFGDLSCVDRAAVERVCKAHGVRVSWEEG